MLAQRGVPKTVPVEVRVDVKAFATLIRFYMHRGYLLKTRSAVLSQMVEDFAASVVEQELTDPFASYDEAAGYVANTVGFSKRAAKYLRDFQVKTGPTTQAVPKSTQTDEEFAEEIARATKSFKRTRG